MILPHGGLRFCLTQVGQRACSPSSEDLGADLAAPDVGSWSRSQPGKVKVKAMYSFPCNNYRCTKNDCGEVYDVQRCSSSSVYYYSFNGKRARVPIR